MEQSQTMNQMKHLYRYQEEKKNLWPYQTLLTHVLQFEIAHHNENDVGKDPFTYQPESGPEV